MNHDQCKRGILPSGFSTCKTAASGLVDSTLTYVTFETSEVETFGKGKTYQRTEKVESELTLVEFLSSVQKEFEVYSLHIVAAWFLRSTKLQLFSLSPLRKSILNITSDFGEAFLVVSKHETADQFFKRREVNLYGSVCEFVFEKEGEDGDAASLEQFKMSYIVSSDCK